MWKVNKSMFLTSLLVALVVMIVQYVLIEEKVEAGKIVRKVSIPFLSNSNSEES